MPSSRNRPCSSRTTMRTSASWCASSLRHAGFGRGPVATGDEALARPASATAAHGRARREHARADRGGGLPRAEGQSADRGVPVLLMSADCGRHQIAAGYAAGADYFLPKPFGAKELLRRGRTPHPVLRLAPGSRRCVMTAAVAHCRPAAAGGRGGRAGRHRAGAPLDPGADRVRPSARSSWLFGVLALLFMTVAPRVFHYRTATMLTGSMSPGIKPGDIILDTLEPTSEHRRRPDHHLPHSGRRPPGREPPGRVGRTRHRTAQCCSAPRATRTTPRTRGPREPTAPTVWRVRAVLPVVGQCHPRAAARRWCTCCSRSSCPPRWCCGCWSRSGCRRRRREERREGRAGVRRETGR